MIEEEDPYKDLCVFCYHDWDEDHKSYDDGDGRYDLYCEKCKKWCV